MISQIISSQDDFRLKTIETLWICFSSKQNFTLSLKTHIFIFETVIKHFYINFIRIEYILPFKNSMVKPVLNKQ